MLLRFNDRNVIDSDVELMQDMQDSESDLLDDYKKSAALKQVSLKRMLESKLRKDRRRKCHMLKQMDEKLALGVGAYKHQDMSYQHDAVEMSDIGSAHDSYYSNGVARSTYQSHIPGANGSHAQNFTGSGRP